MQRNDRRRTGSDLPGLDLAERQAWQHYLEAVLRFDAVLNRALNADHQLSVIDLRVLDILAKSSDGSARMGDVAGLLGATRRQMTNRMDRLGERGLVRRERDPQDKRGVVALLTDDGRTMIDQAIISYAKAVSTYLLGSLSTRQVNTVAENCWRIGEGLRLSELRRALVEPGAPVSVRVDSQAFPEAPTCYMPGVDDVGEALLAPVHVIVGNAFPGIERTFDPGDSARLDRHSAVGSDREVAGWISALERAGASVCSAA